MCGDAVDRASGNAHLRPAAAAMLADAAAAIVVHHDASANLGGALVDLTPHRSHHLAWFMAGDDRALELAKPKRRGFSAGRAIELEITAAHSGRPDFDNDIMGPGRRIGHFDDLQFASTQKAHAAHRAFSQNSLESRMRGWFPATAAGGTAQPRTYPQADLDPSPIRRARS